MILATKKGVHVALRFRAGLSAGTVRLLCTELLSRVCPRSRVVTLGG